ncbi:MAG: FAD-binding oxidoreductase [Sphingobium sp.]|uniref:NAD(P)/FAD-dependent oxidoreductase n=1 Tax=Sphingobium sp. CECT 9361 TaxID=2845384 RepID=UPI001E32596B|nr:FAD-binding oxidoreductase [Sphingobium sp. CECT 9361]CAH0352792.1 D-amino acid dehydrogenase [Sphingobium sp. CECT 9361]
MAPNIAPVQTSQQHPKSTTVVIIGGGIVGLMAALSLSERGIPVVLLEKGKLAGEQSSRNLGWVRKTSRAAADVPMATASDRLWANLSKRLDADLGYSQTGIMFLAASENEMAAHAAWKKSVDHLALDTQLLSNREIDSLVPGGRGNWAGAIYTPSDGRAEPSLAASAIAAGAIRNGAIIVENCAVRTLSLSGGKVNGVVTEFGEIRCDQVLLAGGMWSRRFLSKHKVNLPTLPLVLSVMRTAPMDGPTEIATGGPDFSFRKRLDGGFTISQRGAVKAPLTLDHLLLGTRFLPALKHQRHLLRISLGREFFSDLLLRRGWSGSQTSPFERVRTMDPPVDAGINAEAMRNISAAWPIFEHAKIIETWAGMMDVTPDSLPVVGPVSQVPGLMLATGFSGHGFGTAPAAGQLAADLLTGDSPIIDPYPYRLERFEG